MKGKEKPSLKTGAHFVSGSLKITRKTDEEQERAAQADRSVLVVRDYSSERLCRSCSLFYALFCAEDTVAGIPQPRQNVAVLVELTVKRGNVDFNVGMFGVDFFDSFGSADDCKEFDMFASAFFEERDCVACTAAGCEHRVYKHNDFVLDALGQLAVVLLRFEGFLVAVHTDVSDLCGGEKRENSVHHAESCAEDWHDCDRVFFHNSLFDGFERSFNGDGLRGNVLKRLESHKRCDFADNFSELFGRGVFISYDSHFVADERVIENMHVVVFFHIYTSKFLLL